MTTRVGGFGEKAGLPQRLAYWANQLGRDRTYPWVGTGLIDDLKCAATVMGVDFDTMFPAELPKLPTEPEDEFANFVPAPPIVEWDL